MPLKRSFGRKIGTSYGVAFSPDSSMLVTLGRSVWLWRVSTVAKLARSHPFAHPSHACFSPTSDVCAVKSTSGEIVVLANTGETVSRLATGQAGEGAPIAYSRCGHYIVDATWSGRLLVRDSHHGTVEFEEQFPGDMLSQVHHTADRSVWVIRHDPRAVGSSSPANCYFTVWQWPFSPGGYEVRDFPSPFVRGSSLSPDGKTVAVVHGAPPNTITVAKLADPVAALVNSSTALSGSGSALAWSPTTPHIAAVERDGIAIRDASTLQKLFALPLSFACDVAFSPDGSKLAAGSWSTGLLIDFSQLPLGTAGDLTPNPSLQRTPPG